MFVIVVLITLKINRQKNLLWTKQRIYYKMLNIIGKRQEEYVENVIAV